MTQAREYAAAARELLAKAQEELARGELTDTSEKGWGAAAQMVKAVSQRRGWPHDGHAALFQAVGRLAEETGDAQLVRLFHVANSLRSNFYENWMHPDMIQLGLDNIAELVDKPEGLLQCLSTN